jgi:hypothetical protein
MISPSNKCPDKELKMAVAANICVVNSLNCPK